MIISVIISERRTVKTSDIALAEANTRLPVISPPSRSCCLHVKSSQYRSQELSLVILIYIILPQARMSDPASMNSSHLPAEPQDDQASVQAALAKLQTLRKLSMSTTFTPISQPGSRVTSASASGKNSRAPSQATSPNLLPTGSTAQPPGLSITNPTPGPNANTGNQYPFAAFDDPSLNIGTPNPDSVRSPFSGEDGSQAGPGGEFVGAGDPLTGAFTPEEARALSVPSTPHFGAQGDMYVI